MFIFSLKFSAQSHFYSLTELLHSFLNLHKAMNSLFATLKAS